MSLGDHKRKYEDEEDDSGTSKKPFRASNLLKSAYESSLTELKTPDFRIADLSELKYYQERKRTEFENVLRRNRFNFGQWLRYAQFEVEQKDIMRARSVFERSLEVDYKNVQIWVRYVQTEIKLKNINHARNLLERATKLLPRVDKLWYLYITIEESIGNVIAVKEIFSKWLKWKPNREVWFNYVEFLERYKEFEEERLLFEKIVSVWNTSMSWLKWVDFEKRHGDNVNIENVFKLGVNKLYKNDKLDSGFMQAWITFEYEKKRMDKVKELFDFGTKSLNKEERQKLQLFQADLDKQFSLDSSIIGHSVMMKRKNQQEKQLQEATYDYELWWFYFNLIIDHKDLNIASSEIRSNFEKCLENKPTGAEITQWVLYYYIVYRFALWEEYENKSIDNAKKIYERFKKILMKEKVDIFNFWINYAEFELRNYGINEMRKVLGLAIGITSNEGILKYYINFEMKLKNFDRVRNLYNKLVEISPGNYQNWLKYFDFEYLLGNDKRSEQIIELVIFNENLLNDEDKIKFIDVVVQKLIENYNFQLSRKLLDFKVDMNKSNIKTLINRCLFELKVPSQDQIKKFEEDVESGEYTFEIDDEIKMNVRRQYEKYLQFLKENGEIDNRILLLESLKKFEKKYGTAESVKVVEDRLPIISQKVKTHANGEKEEYIEYLFPEDENEIERDIDEFKNDFLNAFEPEHDIDEEEVEEGLEQDPITKFRSRFASDSEDSAEEEEKQDFAENDEVKSFKNRFEE